MSVSFVVYGDPTPKARPRVVHGHAYTPGQTTAAEARIAVAARRSGVKPAKGPVRLSARFWRATARVCDLDNLAKLVQDALNGIAYVDDSQIVELTATKGIDRDRPRTEVRIEELT
jgi:Holliday junction resolvase RusA-like endonuclease